MTVYKSYPYPVLGNDDDVEGNFSFDLNYTLEPNYIFLDHNFYLDHSTIENLVIEGKAVFISEVICQANFFRKVFSTANSSLMAKIPATDLRGSVTVSSYICTTKSFDDYEPVGTHPDLRGDPFNMEAGDILAIGGVATFIADKTFDPLNAPVSSFMKIQRSALKSGPMSIDYSGDKITILLSEDDYNDYLYIANSAAANIHSSIVLPALLDALYLINTQKADYGDQQWFSRLEQICDEKKLNKEEPFESAQQILQLPVTRNFRQLKNLLEVE